MKKCNNCGKNVGYFFTNACSVDKCNEIFCNKCKDLKLKECEVCGCVYCLKHIDNHECECSAEEKEEEGEENLSGEDIIKTLSNMSEKQLIIFNLMIKIIKNYDIYDNNGDEISINKLIELVNKIGGE